jgi:hypothetical protein
MVTLPPPHLRLSIFCWFTFSVHQRASTTAWLTDCWQFVAGHRVDAQPLYSATLKEVLIYTYVILTRDVMAYLEGQILRQTAERMMK